MNRMIKHSVNGAALLALLTAAGLALASPASDAEALAKGAVPDVTPQQKYQTAIREAGGAYKEWLRECAQLAAVEQRACRLDAKSTYDADMAKAKPILRRQ